MKFGLSSETIEKIKSIFLRHSEVEKAIIYGSRAKGNYRNGSDVDIFLKEKNITSIVLSTIICEIDDLDTPYLFDISIFEDLNSPGGSGILPNFLNQSISMFLMRKNSNINIAFFKTLLLIAFILSNYKTTFAQAYTDEIGTTSANDFYISLKDRYYTNGNMFHYRHSLKQEGIDSTLEKKIFELESGHKIYNPFFAKAPDPATHDRPFTAYLYLGSSFNWFFKNEKLIRVTAQIGTIGPNALGEETQTSYHELLNIFKPRGWEYQLKNEIGLNLSAEYNKLFCRSANKHLDLTGLSAALLGNTFSGANAGAMLRFGQINPIYESVSFNSLIGNKPSDTNGRPKKEYFIFLRPQVNYVAYDATIQGGLFRSDKGPITFGAKPFVFVQDIGASFSSPRWSVNFMATLKSKDVQSTATGYTYATWSVLYRLSPKLLLW